MRQAGVDTMSIAQVAARRHSGKGDKERLAEGEAILRDRSHGMQVSALMEKYGLSEKTVYRRLDDALAARIAPTVDAYREQQNALLDDVAEKWRQQLAGAEAMIEAGTKAENMGAVDRGVARRAEALNGMVRVSERRARLNGLDAPIKVEAHVTHSTPIDDAVSALVGELEERSSTAG
jgi:hypothetical protein